MRTNKQWRYSEFEKVLVHDKSIEELAKELGRTEDSIRLVRNMENAYKTGKNYMSQTMRGHFQRYFTNKGNGHLEEKTTESSPVTDMCVRQTEELVQHAEQLFVDLQSTMAQLAQLQARHQTHEVTRQLEEARKTLDSEAKELQELRELKEKAEKSNFGKMLRGIRPF